MAIQSEQQSNRSAQQQQVQQAQAQQPTKKTSTRGFAAMDAEKHKKVSAQGGRASQQQQHSTRQAQQDHKSELSLAENSPQKNKLENTELSNLSSEISHKIKSRDFDKDL